MYICALAQSIPIADARHYYPLIVNPLQAIRVPTSLDTWFLQKQTQNNIQRGLVSYTNVSLKHGFCKNKYKITFKEARQRHGQGLYCTQMHHEYTFPLTPALCHRVGTNDHIRQ